MHFHSLVLSTLVVLAVAAPTSNEAFAAKKREDIQLADGTFLTVSEATKRSPGELQLADGTYLTIGDATKRSLDELQLADGTILEMKDRSNKQKRSRHDIQLRDGSWLSVRDIPTAQDETRHDLGKREDDKISSCGPRSGWIPINDHGFYNGFPMWGYNSTVSVFCQRASYDFYGNPVIVAAGLSASYTVRWSVDKLGVPDDQRDNRVGLKNDVPGHIEFQINNKRGNGMEYVVTEQDCITFLMHMADPNGPCYGKNNGDTKGGTWQTEDNKLTFHALPAAEIPATPPHDETK
ncbi:hypothetical protein BDV96DRAFT_677394 [Lophiotrema nucula]|uniref:Secreted protein n=1 Tax=Lophiotrema nucula TaxID=690887 RepID=A0A6A5YE68_9PLEO|nr:hypothetical protein BDV96DRAFT_677394 [Lophiotrema nucula]